MKHIEAIVHGRVQGVFYRASTKEKALEFGIRGFVKNQSDGSVLIHAEGLEESLNKFFTWCEQGPAHAVVTNIEKKELPPENFSKFEIRRF